MHEAVGSERSVVATRAPRVAFQGELGAFSEEAVRAFLVDAVPLPLYDFASIGEALRSDAAEYGVLPVENSIHGSVTAAYDVLATGEFVVVAHAVRPIRLCLLGLPGTDRRQVRRVISHPVALAQCARFVSAMPGVEAVATYDTAGAARDVAAASDPRTAAIASRSAAERYGLAVLAEDVQDRSDNQTRFLLITRANAGSPRNAGAAADGGGRILVLVELADRPGALVDVLAPFARHGLNLCSIQSRPAGEPWTYRFFIELAAAADDDALQAALNDVRIAATRLTLLGRFGMVPPA